MVRSSWWEKLTVSVAFMAIAIVVSGTNACREDYDLGSQSSGGTPSPTPTGAITTDDGDGDGDDLETATPTPSVDPDETADATPTVAVIVTVGAAQAESEENASGGFLNELAYLSEKDTGGTPAPTVRPSRDRSANNSVKPTNWLGEGFSDSNAQSGTDEPADEALLDLDSDDDGYADWLEENEGADSSNPDSKARPGATNWREYRKLTDFDGDGASTEEEAHRGTDPSNPDTDGDGVIDGIELLNGDNPTQAGAGATDSDGDGVSDRLEYAKGTDINAQDTDVDGLRDDVELALKSDPNRKDTDKDGIFDGEEYKTGSDPTRSEPR